MLVEKIAEAFVMRGASPATADAAAIANATPKRANESAHGSAAEFGGFDSHAVEFVKRRAAARGGVRGEGVRGEGVCWFPLNVIDA